MTLGRNLPLAALLLGGPIALTPRVAPALTITDCTGDPALGVRAQTTVIDVRPDDLVVRCHLEPLPGTSRLVVYANDVTVAGPEGTLDAPGKGVALLVMATGQVTLQNTSLEAANGNGTLRVLATSGLQVENSVLAVGGETHDGREVRLQCSAPGCSLGLVRSNLKGNRVKLLVQGSITGSQTSIISTSPRDRIIILSAGGDVDLGACGNGVQGGNEGRVRIEAFGNLDLRGTQVATGEDIRIRGGTGGSGSVTLAGATLRNDFGKPGDITVDAADGTGPIDIQGATIIDDNRPARTNGIATLNGRNVLPQTRVCPSCGGAVDGS